MDERVSKILDEIDYICLQSEKIVQEMSTRHAETNLEKIEEDLKKREEHLKVIQKKIDKREKELEEKNKDLEEEDGYLVMNVPANIVYPGQKNKDLEEEEDGYLVPKKLSFCESEEVEMLENDKYLTPTQIYKKRGGEEGLEVIFYGSFNNISKKNGCCNIL